MRLGHRRPLRATLLAILLAMIVAASLAIAGCGEDSDGSSSTTAGSEGTKTYQDPTYGYSFDYPASWQTQQQTSVDVTAGGSASGGVGVFDPDGAKAGETFIDLMLVSVYQLAMTIDDSNFSTLQSEIETVLQGLEGQGTEMQRETELTETTAAGMKGYTVTYSFTKDGSPCMSTLYFLFDGNIEYQLTTQASTENWEADQPIFDAMISSFKPGTNTPAS